jgi:uncharacterized protein YxeA
MKKILFIIVTLLLFLTCFICGCAISEQDIQYNDPVKENSFYHQFENVPNDYSIIQIALPGGGYKNIVFNKFINSVFVFSIDDKMYVEPISDNDTVSSPFRYFGPYTIVFSNIRSNPGGGTSFDTTISEIAE